MKSHHFAIIGVNSGDGDDRSAKIPANIADDCFRVTEVWSGINIEALLVFIITFGFYFLKEEPRRVSISLRRAVRKAFRRKV